MEKETQVKEKVINMLLTKVLKFEKEIINDKTLSSNSNLNKLKNIIEEEVSIDAD